MKKISVSFVRDQIIGSRALYDTPFGKRALFYADYTASGRSLMFVEEQLLEIEKSYANTHTTDDYTGEYLTELLHLAEKKIKDCVKAGEEYKIICTGSGSTGALKRLQEIIGVYIPPHTKDRILGSIRDLKCDSCTVLEKLQIDRPVVFIGPYEHHTNEVMWREAFADIVVIELDDDGRIDIGLLERELKKEKYANRVKYCSFSAGSNITGIMTDAYKIAGIAHKYGASAFFDFAAVAPYVEINMRKDDESYFDAVFLSPHKFLGGPGSAGVLIFHESLYRSDLPPTTAGGGTVDYVGFAGQDYTKDIETREKAGTPPILQTIKTAFVFDIKDKIGAKTIEDAENRNKKMFFDRFANDERIEIIGNKDPDMRIPIISFNIKHLDKHLHPRFVTRLLSDLFGIQSRAGCSCAGPYGHRLLGINSDMSQKYRKMVVTEGISGIKPGWCRINLHYVFTDEDVRFLIKAIDFVCDHGDKFLNHYIFDPKTSEWKHKDFVQRKAVFDVRHDYSVESADPDRLENLRSVYFDFALNLSESLNRPVKKNFIRYERALEDLKYFYHCFEINGEDK
jgi:selenocysteine lyase/cysteine desulfurase